MGLREQTLSEFRTRSFDRNSEREGNKERIQEKRKGKNRGNAAVGEIGAG